MWEDKWSWRRFSPLVFLWVLSGAAGIPAFFRYQDSSVQGLSLTVFGLVFGLFLVVYLEWNRREQGVFEEKANNYKRITLCYALGLGFTLGISFLPEQMQPVMLAPALVAVALNPFGGLLCGGFFSAVLAFGGGQTMYGFAAALLLSMLGSVMMPYMCQRKHMVWGFYMIAGAYVCIHGLFALLGGEHLGLIQAGECLVGALLSGLGIALIFRYCNDRIERSCQHTLKKIVFEDYELAQAMRGYSKADYDHARKVSQIAAGCARKIGVDWELCRAAGFYYRVGRLEGEPYVQSGVALARRYGFPPKLVQILAEYNGEDKLPSTVESAVVHIVDNVVAKFDVLDSSTLSSSWNHDIIVYQSLNENSAKGLYDKSGLSMNMFLLVRDYLIKEAPLYDDHT